MKKLRKLALKLSVKLWSNSGEVYSDQDVLSTADKIIKYIWDEGN